MKHICIFLAFKNLEHIRLSFESMECDEVDFYIIENNSENSDEIYEYFKTKNIKGYFKFEENASANAFDIIIKEHRDLLYQYDYITITDGDLLVYDISETFKEIRSTLDSNICVIATADLFPDNDYRNPHKIVGVDNYCNFMDNNTREFGCVVGNTGNFLLTLKKDNLHLIEGMHYIDYEIYMRLFHMGLKWYKTNKNLVYHLTWDLYVNGEEYYEWKKKVLTHIWGKVDKPFKYKNMIKEKIIIGSGGCARDMKIHMGDPNIKMFVSDEYYTENDKSVYPLSQFNPDMHTVMVGVGDAFAKKKIVESLPKETEYWTYISPHAIILTDSLEIGEGSFISAGVIVTCDVKIGKHVLFNIGSSISHDSVVGDYSTVSPQATICGNVTIGECCYIGANAAIKEKVQICDNTTIGLNCGVVSNITKSGVYIGTPQKIIT